MTEQEQQLIDDVMDTLDFARIAKVMGFLDWKWLSPPHDGVPTEYEIRKEVRLRLNIGIQNSNKYKSECYRFGIGGFSYEVWRENDELSYVQVRFELCSTDAQVE